MSLFKMILKLGTFTLSVFFTILMYKKLAEENSTKKDSNKKE